MKILIDGDACGVISETEEIAKRNGIKTLVFCDTSRHIESEYSEVHIVDRGRDSADFALLRHVDPGDIIVTSDSGLASMALAKQGKVLNQNGQYYTQENIMTYLTRRHIKLHESHRAKHKCYKAIGETDRKHYDFAKALKRLIR